MHVTAEDPANVRRLGVSRVSDEATGPKDRHVLSAVRRGFIGAAAGEVLAVVPWKIHILGSPFLLTVRSMMTVRLGPQFRAFAK
jgi:hypothetical protein